MKSSSGLCG